ncbi:MAG: DUF4124 domain-containing protein [Deltaproteobacteria bacterium]|nr:DUF4124 domain-containing protein [Deltaproteobacteria bacterium]
MKILRYLISALLVLNASCAFAALYQWQDREGVIHITDRAEKVPERYRKQAKVIETTPPKETEKTETILKTEPPPAKDSGEEIFGDHTLEWWRQSLSKKRTELSSLEQSILAKKQYIDVFESGRRFGQIFSTSEVETYERYKKEVSADQLRVSELVDELEELRRKATIAGVPRAIRD